MNSTMAHTPLLSLPLEVVQNILALLDVSSLLQISRTSHLLRTLGLDPLLQKVRLKQARNDLRYLLPHRPSRASISPPNAWIRLTKTNVLSRSISKSLIKIRLSHSLERRPHVDDLVERAILPACCSPLRTIVVSPVIVSKQEDIRRSRLKNKLGRLLKHRPSADQIVEWNILPAECASRSTLSPKLVETRRMVIKEGLKDSLRAWIKSTAIKEQKRKEEEFDVHMSRISVKAIVRKFSARTTASELETGFDGISLEKKRAQARWGRALETEMKREEKRAAASGASSQPTRAHVLGLRQYWEGVMKTAAV